MDLESLLTARDGFKLETASPLQRAIARMIDGAPLGALAELPEVRHALGCDPAALPPVRPVEVVDLEPVRCAKTLRNAALAVARARTVDVSQIKVGEEPPRYSVLSTSTDTARAFRGHLAMVSESPTLRRLVVGDTADSVTIRHPSGLPIEIAVVAASRGGYSLASRWSAGVSFEEAPGWYSTDKIVSLEESRETALGRLLPGAQIIYSGSPWQPSGFCFDAFTSHFGKPTADLLVLRAGPAWVLNPVYWTPERVERIRRTSPRTYAMHLLAEFGSAQNAAFDYDEVLGCFGDVPPGYASGRPFGVLDPSSLRGDSFVAIVASWLHPTGERIPRMLSHPDVGEYTPARDEHGAIQYHPIPTRPILRVSDVVGWDGRLLGKVTMAAVIAECARMFRYYGVSQVFSDQREDASLAGLLSQHGFGNFRSYHWTSESKTAAVTTLRRLMGERTLSLCPNEKMRAQLLAYGYRLAAGGRYEFQGRGTHDDYCATLLTLAHALNDPDAQGVDTGRTRRMDGNPSGGRPNQRTERSRSTSDDYPEPA